MSVMVTAGVPVFFRAAVIQMERASDCVANKYTPKILRPLNDSSCCQRAVTCCHSLYRVNPGDCTVLPAASGHATLQSSWLMIN